MDEIFSEYQDTKYLSQNIPDRHCQLTAG